MTERDLEKITRDSKETGRDIEEPRETPDGMKAIPEGLEEIGGGSERRHKTTEVVSRRLKMPEHAAETGRYRERQIEDLQGLVKTVKDVERR